MFEALFARIGLLFYLRDNKNMEVGHFYYLKDQYFIDFPDEKLMQNKAVVDGQRHDRPCFYAFLDESTGLYWMRPFSHDVSKYKKYYDKKVEKYGECDTIDFGKVLGHEKAFLIQNMCPATQEYINNEYIDSKAHVSVRVDGVLEERLKRKARKVLALHKKGIKLIFPNVEEIEKKLLEK